MTKQEIHEKLVNPICALEEYVDSTQCDSAIVTTISIALRHILNEIEVDAYYNKEVDE